MIVEVIGSPAAADTLTQLMLSSPMDARGRSKCAKNVHFKVAFREVKSGFLGVKKRLFALLRWLYEFPFRKPKMSEFASRS
jgi:hypothetical protein